MIDRMTPVDTRPVVELRDIVKRFGAVLALDHASLVVSPGEIVALVGDNGAGKSTLLKVIAGVHQPDEGSLLIDGALVKFASAADARASGVNVVYQDLALAEDLDVTANLFLGRELTRWPMRTLDQGAMRREAREILGELKIQIPSVRTKVRHLSGGQRQGVSIGRATHWGRRLIVMDEPTAALGVQETQRVEEVILGLRAKGRSILIVSHNLGQVFRLSDRIFVLRRGQMIGTVATRQTTGDDVVAMITGSRE